MNKKVLSDEELFFHMRAILRAIESSFDYGRLRDDAVKLRKLMTEKHRVRG